MQGYLCKLFLHTVKTMKKCSTCGLNGHNSRTCEEKGCVKLFGVKIKRSKSTGDLEDESKMEHVEQEGYGSDGYRSARPRQKGKPWTEEEHKKFLSGLMRRGKGDWRGISKNFVPTRTPTQVASHAQKYFMRRQTSAERKKRRASVFDMALPGPGGCSASLELKETIETQEQVMKNNGEVQGTHQFPYFSMESAPIGSTLQQALPYSMVKFCEWTTPSIRPGYHYLPVPYNNGGFGKLTPCAVVHTNPIFPTPPMFPPSTSSSNRPDSLELELKVGKSLPQSPRAASGPIGVTS